MTWQDLLSVAGWAGVGLCGAIWAYSHIRWGNR